MFRRLATHLINMAESAAKRVKTTADDGAAATIAPLGVTIGTHNGHFHADEALAVYMLRQHIPEYAGAALVRTRDDALLAGCHTVVDVGRVYSPERLRFDHHQDKFDETFPGRKTKLSSAGLVYMNFGLEIIRNRLGAPDSDNQSTVDMLYAKLYESFIEALDAHDNGIDQYDPDLLAAAGAEKRFSTTGFTLGSIVSRLNPNWNDPVPEDPVEAQAAEDLRFEAASARIGEEFDRHLDFYTRSWLPARSVVAEAFADRMKYDDEGRILVFKGQSVPWKEHLFNLEVEAAEKSSKKQEVLYVLYPEKPVPDAVWRIQTVPLSVDSFQSRHPLPKVWGGKVNEELDALMGIAGGVFVHKGCFIGGHKTFAGALAMARKALDGEAPQSS